jgi:hypothetical protein
MHLMGCAVVDVSLDSPRRGRAREAGHPVRCGSCGRSYPLGAWLALPLVKTLSGDAIAAYVVKWRFGVLIEVRRCAHCAASIARMSERPL